MTEDQAKELRSAFANGIEFKKIESGKADALFEIVNEMIEKNIPKKAMRFERQEIKYVTEYECPNCGGLFTGELSSYCYHCGQKIFY